MSEHCDNFNKEIENIRKYQSELKNTINEIKILCYQTRLDYTEEQISNLKDRVVEIIQAKQKKNKK